jgi:hypothetical protein
MSIRSTASGRPHLPYPATIEIVSIICISLARVFENEPAIIRQRATFMPGMFSSLPTGNHRENQGNG